MSTWTNRGLVELSTFDPAAVVLRAGLLTTQTADATVRDWNTVADVVAEVTTAAVSNYARITVPTVSTVEDDTNDRMQLTCGNLAFGSLATGATPNAVFFFRRVGAADATTDPVWAVFWFTGTPTNGAAYTVTIPATGFAIATHAP